MRAIIVIYFVVAVAGCSASGSEHAIDSSGGGSGGGAGGSGGPDMQNPDGGTLFDGAATSGGGAAGCSKETQLVYVVDHDRKLYQFDPPALTFTQVGQLDCATQQTFSMAVDRNAVAWALALDGTMVRYDIDSHACTPLAFAKGQYGFITFGMGFSSNAPGSTDDTLFVASASGLGLATIDTTSLELTPVGPFDELEGRAELTGTGDARLFGAFEGVPYVVAEIDKKSASVVSQAPQSAIVQPAGGSNFAFAFWGGDFWLFVGPGGQTTDVFRYQPKAQTTTKVASAPFQIVGAGVSTCAPTEPPK